MVAGGSKAIKVIQSFWGHHRHGLVDVDKYMRRACVLVCTVIDGTVDKLLEPLHRSSIHVYLAESREKERGVLMLKSDTFQDTMAQKL